MSAGLGLLAVKRCRLGWGGRAIAVAAKWFENIFWMNK